MSKCLRFETCRCINAIILYLLVQIVREYNMGKNIDIERMKWVKKVEKVIGEIK